jgi:hypothetical protein
MNQAEAAVAREEVEARSAAREQSSAKQPEPSEAQLLDVLYEVLAQGVPPKGSLRREDVERFLHEHARNRKSIPQMLEFFAKHKLPVSAAEYGADPQLGELASGLSKDRVINTFAPLEAEDTARRVSDSGPVLKLAVPPVEIEDTPSRPRRPVEIVVASPPAKAPSVLPKVAFALSTLLGAALIASVLHARSLSSELERARLTQRSTEVALSALEARAESLQSSLTASENERRGLADRFDSFVLGEAQKRAAEETALERILGPRFETLRNKALQDAYLAAP